MITAAGGPRTPLSPQEAAALVQAASGPDLASRRDLALLALLWRCQSRVSAALRIFPRHVDFANGAILIERDKWGSGRVIGADPQAIQAISQWLRARAEEAGIGRDNPIICSFRAPWRAITRQTAFKRIAALGRKAGLARPIFPHLLRHTGAYELMTESAPLTIIQRQLGHRNLTTTEIYVNHSFPADVIRTMRRRSWPAGSDQKFRREPPSMGARAERVAAKRSTPS